MAERSAHAQRIDSLECPICRGRLRDPRILTCAHTFCLPCLILLETREHGGEFRCPCCRSPVDLPENGVRGLPANYTLVNLMAELQLGNRRPDASSVCEFCKRDSGLRCFDCKMYLCESCEETHKRVVGSNDHTVIRADKLSDEKYVREAIARKAPKCSEHRGEDIRFFCKTCQKLVCRDCIVVVHNGHRCVEVTNWSLELKGDLERLLKLSKDQGLYFDRIIKHSNDTTFESLGKFSACKRQINDRFDELKAMLGIDRRELLRKTEEVEKETCDKMTNVSDCMRQWMEQTRKTQAIVEKVISDDNQWEIIGMETTLADRLEEMSRSGRDLYNGAGETQRDVIQTEPSFRVAGLATPEDYMRQQEDSNEHRRPNIIGDVSFRSYSYRGKPRKIPEWKWD